MAGRLREGKDETDIRVRLAERDRRSIDRIAGMDLASPRGPRKLSDVAQVGVQDGPSVIEHEDRERQIAVNSQIASSGKGLGDIAVDLRRAVAAHPLPPGYTIKYDGQIKTLAVRLSEDTRAQLDIIAQLNDRTVTDEIRLAIEAWIEKTKSDPSVLQRAQFVRDQIDREAATKRGAIEAIFNKTPAKQKASPSSRAGAEKEGTN